MACGPVAVYPARGQGIPLPCLVGVAPAHPFWGFSSQKSCPQACWWLWASHSTSLSLRTGRKELWGGLRDAEGLAWG